MRIGLFGGSFNPVHKMHIEIAYKALEFAQLDEVWFLPVFKHAIKPNRILLSYQSRRAMLQIATRGCSKFRIADIEREMGKTSFTVDTVECLLDKFPDNDFFLILGSDCFEQMNLWKKPDRLAKIASFIVIPRTESIMKPFADLNYKVLSMPKSECSSENIREKIASNNYPVNELDQRVLFEIITNGYYCSDDSKILLKKISDLHKVLPKGLKDHMFSVARLSMKYAQELRINEKNAVIAGLAHDLFRLASSEMIMKYATEYDYQFSTKELNMPMLAHGAAAAGFLKKLNVSHEVLNAVTNHTSPEQDCEPATKVLVVADTLDPLRQDRCRDQLRESNIPFCEKFTRAMIIKKEYMLKTELQCTTAVE